MTDTNKKTPTGQTANADADSSSSCLPADEPDTRFVSSCPWGDLRGLFYCDKLPATFTCGTDSCWQFGQQIKHLPPEVFTRENLSILAKAFLMADANAINALVDRWMAEHKPPA